MPDGVRMPRPTHKIYAGATEFEVVRDLIDVTSRHRPHVGWSYVDAEGHEHRWYVEGENEPATGYNPNKSYRLPTLIWVKEGIGYYPDGSEYGRGHHECRQCGEEIKPSYTEDTHRQYIHGISHYYINGKKVIKEEFERRLQEAKDSYDD